MDARTWGQDVLRCHLCETPGPPMYCAICHIHMCKACVGEHLSDESTEHKVVSFKKRGLNPKCSKHSTQLCDLHCEQCNIPICVECVSSGEHLGHVQLGILKILEKKKEALQRDLQELEKNIYPKYQEMASNIPVQKADLNKNSNKLTKAIERHGEELHREIDTAITKLKSDVDEMEFKHITVLNEQEDKIKRSILEIEESIADLNRLMNSNDVNLVSAYKSRNAEFKKLPPKVIVSLPRFTPQKINKEHIYQQIGSLSAFPIKTEDHGYTVDSSSAGSTPLDRLLIDVPRIIREIHNDYGELNNLLSASCLSDDEVWTSGNTPIDIAVTQSGELVYTDPHDRTVNIVKNAQIQTVIRLQGWKPWYICSASDGGFLVVMENEITKHTKVVRYSDSREKQTIQYNDKGQPLYSSQSHTKYICENKNQDICVADSYTDSPAVVVVNQAGKLRYTYTDPPLPTKVPFEPVGITTDSQSRILASDINNQCIHILDQDGQFLRYIENLHLQHPRGLWVDTRGFLFLSERYTGIIKKIQYYI